MRKINLFKSVVCGVLVSFILGTSVWAGTIERTIAARGVSEYSDYYSGTVGQYSVTGKSTISSLKVVNTSSSPKLFYAAARRYNQYTDSYDLGSTSSYVLTPGQYETKSVERDMNNTNYDYHHFAEGFYSTTSSVRLDFYTFKAQQ